MLELESGHAFIIGDRYWSFSPYGTIWTNRHRRLIESFPLCDHRNKSPMAIDGVIHARVAQRRVFSHYGTLWTNTLMGVEGVSTLGSRVESIQ